MARTKKTPPIDTSILEPITEAMHAPAVEEDKIANIAETYAVERDLMNQLLGEAQAFNAMSQFTGLVRTIKLANIKETKIYRALKGRTMPDGSELSGTWAEFCDLVGSSVDMVDEDIRNLHSFGEDALNNLNRIGAGYRELRKLRKLPEDVRQEVAGQLVNLEDKEEIVALIDDLSAKHATEKQALEKQVAELTEDAEATDKVLGDKSTKIDQLEKEVHKLRNKTGDWHPRVFEINMETTRVAAAALESIDRMEQLRDAILEEDFGDVDQEKALEALAVVYFDAADHLLQRAMEMMAACNNVFIGYKDRAKPMLQLYQEQQSAAVEGGK